MKVEFNVKYGKNDKFTKKFTIYNDIPEYGAVERHFDRFVIGKCLVYGGSVERAANGTVQNIVNAQTVVTRDIAHYKPPMEYLRLPADEKDKYYTVKANDFIVFDEVDDVVTTSLEFRDLQDKYKDNGMSITSVNPYIFGMLTDNITMTNA